MTATIYPLPRVGLCPAFPDEFRVKADGTLYRHGDGDWTCPGSGIAVDVLEPTFLRWLWSHRSRRDPRDNWVVLLAEFTVGLSYGCGARTIRDIPWTTAEELHTHLHRNAPDRNPGGEGNCNRLCAEVRQAEAVHAELIARHLHAVPETTKAAA